MIESQQIPESRDASVACKDCSLFQLCLPVGPGDADLDLLERVIKRRRLVRRGEYLYRPGEPLIFIYAVKSGSVMTTMPLEGGSNQVSGFHLPGEVLGMDAIDARVHGCGALALETTSVCEVPFSNLEDLGNVVSGVQQQLLRIMSKQILHDQMLQVLLRKRSAEERLAAFLASLSARLNRRGFSSLEFNLSMSREEIGNYLGLAEETVSRLFTRFQEDGVVTAKRKHVRIHDLEALNVAARLPKYPERANVV
jgi:CRP/FNR family transcriptional regulator